MCRHYKYQSFLHRIYWYDLFENESKINFLNPNLHAVKE